MTATTAPEPAAEPTPDSTDAVDQGLDADVIVVGGGPVGTSTGLKLALGGLRVIVLEARAATSLDARATTFHPPTLEMLEAIGVTDTMIERGLIAPSYQFRDAKLGKIVDLEFSILEGDTKYPFRLQLEQSNLTSLAIEGIEKHPTAEFHSSSRVTEIREDSAGVFVEVVVEGGARAGTLRARHLIGADGMRSVVRDHLGVAFTGHTYPERYLVLATREPLHDLLEDLAAVNYVADPVNWHVLLRNPSGWRILFPAPPLDGSDEEVLADANVLERFHRVLPDHGMDSIERVTLYEVHRKVAEKLRVGPIYLVGDAAHVNNPLGGMGLNSGVHDGLLLADVLLSGLEGAELDVALDDWAKKRRAVARHFVGEETDGNWAALRNDDEVRRRAQHAAWRALANDDAARREFLLRSSMLASLGG